MLRASAFETTRVFGEEGRSSVSERVPLLTPSSSPARVHIRGAKEQAGPALSLHHTHTHAPFLPPASVDSLHAPPLDHSTTRAPSPDRTPTSTSSLRMSPTSTSSSISSMIGRAATLSLALLSGVQALTAAEWRSRSVYQVRVPFALFGRGPPLQSTPLPRHPAQARFGEEAGGRNPCGACP